MASPIVNPVGAFKDVTDFRTQKTAGGELLLMGDEQYAWCQANAAIVKGEVVMLVAAADATTPLRVAKMTTAADARLFVGVAEEAASAAGEIIKVCTKGVTELYVNAQTVAFGDVILKPGTNAGEASCSSTDPDATTVAGTVLGVVLYAKNSSNLAPVRIDPR